MKNLVMPIIIGFICCMLLGYVDKGQREVASYREIASKQNLLRSYNDKK